MLDPSEIENLDQFKMTLAELRSSSSFSFKRLSREIDSSTTTVHGWFSGRHLPYQRDNSKFLRMLAVLGVEEPEPWVEVLARLRANRPVRARENPYRGLEPFAEQHAHLFFGREALIESATERIVRGRRSDEPTIVWGPSGCGKSSLLQAGIAPYLRQALRATVIYTTPSPTPGAFRSQLRAILPESPAASTYLLVDQLEVLLAQPVEDVAEALDALSALAAERGSRVVLGLRADYAHIAASYPYLASALEDPVLVRDLSHSELTEVITGPAAHAGLEIEPALLAELLGDFTVLESNGRKAEALPLLSHLLYVLAEAPDGNRLTQEVYAKAGGVNGALRASADRAYEALDLSNREACRLLFTQFVELGHEAQPVRRQVDLLDLEASTSYEGDFDAVLSSFAEARLLTVDADNVQVSHEALLSAWPTLASWISDDAESLRTTRTVRIAAGEWSNNRRSPDALLTGSRLEPAQRLLADPRLGARLQPLEREFIQTSTASQLASDRRVLVTRRVLQVLVAGLAVVSMAAAALALAANGARTEANEARARAELARDESTHAREDAEGARTLAQVAQAEAISRQLALQATILRRTDPSLSGQVALVAYDTSATVEARSAVRGASSFPAGARYLGAPGSTALAASPDGSMAVFSNAAEGTITLLSREGRGAFERETIMLEDPDATVYALEFAPDGSYFVSAGADRTATVWSLQAPGRHIRLGGETAAFEGLIQTVAVSDDGSTIYAGAEGPGIARWMLDRSGQEVGSDLLPMAGEVMSMDLDSDRDLLAVAMRDGTVALLDVGSGGTVLSSFPPLDETVASTVALSPTSPLVAAGYRNSRIRVWDASDPTEPIEIEAGIDPFASWVTWVSFSPSGSVLAAASSDGTVRLIDTETWEQVGQGLEHPTVVTSLGFLDERSLVVSVADGSVRYWDLTHESFEQLGASIWSTSFDSTGESLVASSGSKAAVWSFRSDGRSALLEELVLPGTSSGLTGAAALHPDGDLAALGTRTGPVYLMPVGTAQLAPIELAGLTDLVENVVFSPAGDLLVGGDDDGRIQLWRGRGGEWRPAGRLRIEDQAMNVAFSPDSALVAAASDEGPVYLIDVTDPESPAILSNVLSGDSIALSVAFHPKLPLVATGNADTRIRVWDYSDSTSPRLVSEIPGPSSRVFSLAFNKSGDRLAAAVGDNAAWVWTIEGDDGHTWDLESVLSSPGKAMLSVAFSPDGKTLVGAGSDQHLVVWLLDDGAVRGALCSKVGERITENEWNDLIPSLAYQPPCE